MQQLKWWWWKQETSLFLVLKKVCDPTLLRKHKIFQTMGFLHLFYAASMPVLKVLFITALGSFLALDQIDILGETARNHVNRIVFFVFNPALVGSNVARTITSKSIVKLWFMPINILFTFLLGSALGCILVAITQPPSQLKGLILGSCAAGNLGGLPLIIIPAVCREKGSPFGNPDVCHEYGMAYASLSMAVGAVFLWSYIYNIVRIFSSKTKETINLDDSIIDIMSVTEMAKQPLENSTPSLFHSKGHSFVANTFELTLPMDNVKEDVKVVILGKIKQQFSRFSRQINIRTVFAPSTIGALCGFTIGTIAPVRKLLIGSDAPLHGAAIPTLTLIVGGNLVRGLRGSGVKLSLIVGVVVVRYVFLPVLGIIIVKVAIRLGLIHSDPLYQFVLLLQFALPPAINIGTMTQLFGGGESECSVIMLWTYSLASVSVTLWSAFFMWLVS